MEPDTPTKPAKLPIKQAKYVKAIIEGKSQRQAGLAAGASTGVAADKYANRLSKNVNVQDILKEALAKHNIDLDNSLAPIGKALHAMKMNEFTGEITEDLGMQLKASDRALKLMGVGQDKDTFSAKYVQIINEKGSIYNE